MQVMFNPIPAPYEKAETQLNGVMYERNALTDDGQQDSRKIASTQFVMCITISLRQPSGKIG